LLVWHIISITKENKMFTLKIRFTDHRPAEIKTFPMHADNTGYEETRHNAKSFAGRVYNNAKTVKSVRVTDPAGKTVLYLSHNAKRMVSRR
jgi:hypothetical protein